MFLTQELTEDEARRRASKHALTAAIRRLVEEAALLDASEADEEQVALVAARVESAADLVAAQPSLRRHGSLTVSPGFAGNLDERSPVSGAANAVASPLRYWRDGDLLRAEAVWGAVYEGPPGSLHGGMVAAAFDELLGVAQSVSGLAGYTGTLTIKMRRLTPLHKTVRYEAGVSGVRGRKITVWGRSYDGDDVTAEAEGLFIAPRPAS